MRECEGCRKREFSNERDFKFCGRCKLVLYCSKECQRNDWKRHKTTCQECKDDVTTLPHCGMCGARKGPFKLTECCSQRVCDDEYSYRVFSYNRIHCSRNHSRYSVCGNHFSEKHQGQWENCKKCRCTSFNPEKSNKVTYDYAARAGNPPHFPFKFNFDETAKKFNWSTLDYPKCLVCDRKVDTILDSFATTMSSMQNEVVCMECHHKGYKACACPLVEITNSMEKY